MRALALLVVLAAVPGACACSKTAASTPDAGVKIDTVQPGQHLIDFVQYNDTNEVYRVFVIGRPVKTEPQHLTNVRLAHLSDEDVEAGKKPYLTDDGSGPVLWIGTNFKIGYMHGVVDEQTDAASGKKSNIVLRFEKRLWSPFQTANALGGAAVFGTPAYYFAPPYTDDILVGIGGMGPTRQAAYEAYRVTHGSLPQPVRLALEGFIEQKAEPPSDGGMALAASGVAAIDPETIKPRRVIGVIPGYPAARRQLREMQQARNTLARGGKPQERASGEQPTTTKNMQPAPAVRKKP